MKPENPGASLPEARIDPGEVPPGVDRRTFMMRSAVITSAAVITGCSIPEKQQTAAASAPPPQVKESLSSDLNVVKKAKGPVMTTLEEFYKVGPGPSSSHTIGPMRITYDFYQRCTQLPKDQLARVTEALAGKVASIRVVGRKPEEIIP